MDPIRQLKRIAFYLERDRASTHRVRAFRRAAWALEALEHDELDRRCATGTLTDLDGVGPVTARVVLQAADGQLSGYLRRLQDEHRGLVDDGRQLRAQLQGDLHTHSDWSDGGSPIVEMAQTAAELGHAYLAVTDHSPRLSVARGLDAGRLRAQLGVIARVNQELAGLRILTGIEVDINEDGSLDQDEELLARVDLVVASVHSKLAMDSESMTRRMVAAVANPHVDVLGHCTGRLLGSGRGTRPGARFDAELVFEACRRFDVAVEVNCRPERLDPPRRLLRLAVERGCVFAIDTDAHAPGQLDWQPYGCARAQECDVPTARVVNTWSLDELLAWTGGSAAEGS